MNNFLAILSTLVLLGCGATHTSYNVLKTKPVRIVGPNGKECLVGQTITIIQDTRYLTKPPCNVTIIEDHEPREIERRKKLDYKGTMK